MPRLAALALSLLLAAAAAAEDCKDCADGKVCITHEASDDIAVKGAQLKLKSKDMIGKREAIYALSDAQEKHMNVRSRKITAELIRAVGDADVDVKLLAAEKLAAVGEPALAVQGLSGEVTKYRKLLGATRPKKEKEVPAWDGNLRMLTRMYESLAQVPSPTAAATFEEDVVDSNPFVAAAAAAATKPFKGHKGVIKALYDGMRKWVGPSQQPARPEGSVEAVFAMSRALQEVVENPPKARDGETQQQAMARWDAWYKENEGKLK